MVYCSNQISYVPVVTWHSVVGPKVWVHHVCTSKGGFQHWMIVAFNEQQGKGNGSRNKNVGEQNVHQGPKVHVGEQAHSQWYGASQYEAKTCKK
jgi:hypothetical protein